MAGEITLSSAVRSNLLALQNTADLLGKTQEKLATGLKVNSALDDPTAFFTASSLNSRANDLSRLQDFVGNAVQTIKAADEGISAITKLVESAEATARQALQSAGQTASNTGTLDTTASTSFDFSAEATATGNVDLDGAGAFDFAATATGTGVTVSGATLDDFAATNTGSGVTVDAANFEDFEAVVTATVDLDSANVAGGDDGKQFTISDGTNTTADITINTGDDATTIQGKIAAALTAASITSIVATEGSGGTAGQIILTGTDADVTIAEGTVTGGAAAIGFTAGETKATNSLGIASGDTFTVDNDSGSPTTITFGDAAGEVNTLAELDSALEAVTGITSSIDGSNNLIIATDDGNNLNLVEGTNSPLANLGITAGTTTASNTLGISNGDTFTVQNGTDAAVTITFGTDGGSNEVNTLAELDAALEAITGITASVDGSNNLVIASDNGENITLGAGVGTPLTELGLTAGAVTATNSFGIENGDTFTVQVGTAAAQTVTFGADGGSGEVNTLAELEAALDGFTDVTAAVDGTTGFLSITTTTGDDLTIAEGTNTPLADLGLTAGVTTADTTATSGIAYGDAFSVQVGTAAATTITFGSSTGQVDTSAELLTALNAIDNITANVTDDGFLKVEATNGEDLTIAEVTNTPAGTLGFTVGASSAAANTDRAAFATQFNELRSQIDQLANDASYNGINLLDSDSLTVTFNEDATSSLSVSGVSFNSNGLGISSAENTFQTDGDINAALTDLNTATDTLRSQASKFGSNLSVVETRQDFTKNLINVLETGAANLTLADTNEEGANLLALQTRQQLSSTALSLASQADQNVLRLF